MDSTGYHRRRVKISVSSAVGTQDVDHRFEAPSVLRSHPQPLQRLMMAQDTGGAIKGRVRGDFFWGMGAEAGAKAGSMKQTAKFWVLLPNTIKEQQ